MPHKRGRIHFSQFFQSPVSNVDGDNAGTIMHWGQFWGVFSLVGGTGAVIALVWGAITGQGIKAAGLHDAVNPVVWFSNMGAAANGGVKYLNGAVIDPTNKAIQSGQFTPIPMSPSDPSRISAPPNAPAPTN